MFKVLIFVTIFAVPIFGGVSDKEESYWKSIFEELWRKTCKNVSGIDVNLEKIESLYLEYKNCKNNTINVADLKRDSLKVFSKLLDDFEPDVEFEKSSLITVAQEFSLRYCPKVHNYVECKDIMSPIYNGCFIATEFEGVDLNDDLKLRFSDFFCENNAERVTQFINGNVTECAMNKRAELMKCYEEYELSMLKKSKNNLLLGSVPTQDSVCKCTDHLKICVTQIFESCEMSPIPGKLITSLFKSLHTETLCAEFSNATFTRGGKYLPFTICFLTISILFAIY